MNRLILIGNGFDLAHGLKTRYSDFIKHYISESLNEFYLNNNYSDILLSISFKNKDRYFTKTIEPCNADNVLDRLEAFNTNSNYQFIFKSKLLSNTFDNLKKYNWVDIENQYFIELLTCRHKDRISNIYKFEDSKIKDLNDEFEYLKSRFIDYLNKICLDRSFIAYTDYINLFTEDIKDNDLQSSVGGDTRPQNINIVSFNYTFNARNYQEECIKKNPSTRITYIHGELNEKNNPIIFGFGDEYDKNYLDFEDFKNNDLFKHVKSFGYLKTSNYHNLMKFIDSNDFQVYVFGHSLGLSDRTMLKQIFEHQKCKSIKLFFHSDSEGNNDFTEKTYEAARHFTDKGIMRLKIVSQDRSERMPQFG